MTSDLGKISDLKNAIDGISQHIERQNKMLQYCKEYLDILKKRNIN